MSKLAKKLVWGEPKKTGVIQAPTPFGHYTIFPDGEWWGPQVGNNTGSAGDVDAAKVACDANFERLVNECLI